MEPLFVITDTIEVSCKAKDQGGNKGTDYTSHVTTSTINIVIVISYSLDMSLTNSTQ